MSVNAPARFAAGYAFECLWDCEEETREIGCKGVLTQLPGAEERLRTLAEDPYESEAVRSAAQARLGTA